MKQCPNCGEMLPDYAMICTRCGARQESSQQTPPPHYSQQQQQGGYNAYNQQQGYNGGYNGGYGNEEQYLQRNNAFDSDPVSGKSRGVAGLLAIFLGGLGVQYFYLGKTAGGIICLLLTLVTCGIWDIVPFIQGILMLCMDNRSFIQKYVNSTSTMPLF